MFDLNIQMTNIEHFGGLGPGPGALLRRRRHLRSDLREIREAFHEREKAIPAGHPGFGVSGG